MKIVYVGPKTSTTVSWCEEEVTFKSGEEKDVGTKLGAVLLSVEDNDFEAGQLSAEDKKAAAKVKADKVKADEDKAAKLKAAQEEVAEKDDQKIPPGKRAPAGITSRKKKK